MRRATSTASARLLVLTFFAIASSVAVAAAASYETRSTRAPRRASSSSQSAAPRFRAYTWGIGGERVGRPSNPSSLPPARVELDESAGDVVAIAASGHTAVVVERGWLYTAGRNASSGGGGRGSPPIEDSGQLGRGGSSGAMERVIGALSDEVVTSVACGRYHTVVSTESGAVYSFGLNDAGQLGTAGVMGKLPINGVTCDSGGNCDGLERASEVEAKEGSSCFGGSSCRIGTPRRVRFSSHTVEVRSVAAGRYSSAAIASDGTVYVWGLNSCGDSEIGRDELLADASVAAVPRVVNGITDVTQVDIGYTNMIFLTSSGRVVTCDTGFTGYAQVQANADVSLRQHITFADAPSTQRAFDVAAGRCHYVVATEGGGLYTWGCDGAWLGRDGDPLKPAQVGGDLASRAAVSVAAGEYFTLVATVDGEVYGMGAAGNGQLGVQASNSGHNSPIRVNVGDAVGTLAVAAGYQHSVAIVRSSD
jgi:regulator of chromosome condensation